VFEREEGDRAVEPEDTSVAADPAVPSPEGEATVAGHDAPTDGGEPGRGPEGSRSPRHLLRTATLFYAALMLVPLWWMAASEGPDPFYPGGFSWADTVGGFITGTLAALAVVAFSAIVMSRTRWGRALGHAFARALGPLTRAQVIWLSLLSGVGEEMFFRGLLQHYLGLTITSVLFGLLHFVPRREMLPWTLLSIAAGFLLGWLYAFAGTLVAPIACHVLVNGINLNRIAVERRKAGSVSRV
jgi:membrane protease YdiL (CAAX protease family)